MEVEYLTFTGKTLGLMQAVLFGNDRIYQTPKAVMSKRSQEDSKPTEESPMYPLSAPTAVPLLLSQRTESLVWVWVGLGAAHSQKKLAHWAVHVMAELTDEQQHI